MATLPFEPDAAFGATTMRLLSAPEHVVNTAHGWIEPAHPLNRRDTGSAAFAGVDLVFIQGNAFTRSVPLSSCDALRGTYITLLNAYPMPVHAQEWSKVQELAQSWLPKKQKVVGGWFSKLDRIITELGRLQAGWDGDVAPTPDHALLNQIERALRALPHNTKEPEVEVDPSDGSVAVRWWSSDNKSSFTMAFTGNSRLYAVVSSVDQLPPPSWECSVHDETKIDDRIAHPLVRKVLVEAA